MRNPTSTFGDTHGLPLQVQQRRDGSGCWLRLIGCCFFPLLSSPFADSRWAGQRARGRPWPWLLASAKKECSFYVRNARGPEPSTIPTWHQKGRTRKRAHRTEPKLCSRALSSRVRRQFAEDFIFFLLPGDALHQESA